MLLIKAYLGKSKQKKIQQKLPPVGIEPETFFVDYILLFPT